MPRLFQITSYAFLCPLIACADVANRSESAGQELALRVQPVDHGELSFGAPAEVRLSRDAPVHSFHFTLTAPGHVAPRTLADATGRSVDTVLSLFRGDVSHALAVNDDDGRSRFSQLERDLPAGAYRLVVQGFKRSTEGSFLLAADCQGAGCPTAQRSCLFGDTFYQLRSEALLTVLDEHWIRAPGEIASTLEGQQVVLAVQESSHTDVVTPAEALAAVDQSELRRMRLRDEPSGREYDVFEYGAGDNSYGAIFRADSLVKAASIHDGDLLECTEWWGA